MFLSTIDFIEIVRKKGGEGKDERMEEEEKEGRSGEREKK